MARPLRIEYPGALYHVTSRGNARQEVFWDDVDRRAFLEVLSQVIERFGWLCHAYCLMPNHYHLLIETLQPNLSRGMRQLNGVYTQAFNRRHRRVGHLFGGRFKAIVVQKESYLLELARYVVLNPVRAGRVRAAKDWPWSSYRATVGMSPVPSFLTTEWILSHFARSRTKAHGAYRRFVSAGKGARPWEELPGQIYLGSNEFVRNLPKGGRGLSEVPRAQREGVRPSLEDLLGENAAAGMVAAYRTHGYAMREIAEFLGVHYATVSRRIRRYEQDLLDCKT
ncbi:transposase [Candidatus Bipolaricaulota bacterium]|nr:transposase [Candidatus Bipolaricaulota bacterium]